jgi:hypothetical protein
MARFQAACNAGPGTVFIPAGTWAASGASGGVTVPPGVSIKGEGAGSTYVNHTGGDFLFDFRHGAGDEMFNYQQSVRDLRINGDATASAGGIGVADCYGFEISGCMVGNYSAGWGVLARNDEYWTEGLTILNTRLMYNNQVGIEFSTGGTHLSFGYTRIFGLGINVSENCTGWKIGRAADSFQTEVYNSTVRANIWVEHATAIGVDCTSKGWVHQTEGALFFEGNGQPFQQDGIFEFHGPMYGNPRSPETMSIGDVKLVEW